MSILTSDAAEFPEQGEVFGVLSACRRQCCGHNSQGIIVVLATFGGDEDWGLRCPSATFGWSFGFYSAELRFAGFSYLLVMLGQSCFHPGLGILSLPGPFQFWCGTGIPLWYGQLHCSSMRVPLVFSPVQRQILLAHFFYVSFSAQEHSSLLACFGVDGSDACTFGLQGTSISLLGSSFSACRRPCYHRCLLQKPVQHLGVAERLCPCVCHGHGDDCSTCSACDTFSWEPLFSACRRQECVDHVATSCRGALLYGPDDAVSFAGAELWQQVGASPHGHDKLLESLVYWGTGCLNSFLALMLASLLRLLLFAGKLKGGQCNADPLLRGSRHILRGAPMRFWMLFTSAYFWHPAAAVRGSENPADLWRDLQVMDQNLQLITSASEFSNVVESADFLEPPPFAQLPQDWVMEQVPAPMPDVKIAVQILQFQKCDIYSAVWTTPGMSGDEMVARVTSVALADQQHFNLFDAYPQPCTDKVIMGVAPRWWRNSNIVPIILDASGVDKPMVLLAVPKMCSFDDLREVIPDTLWPSGAKLVFESDDLPLHEGRALRPTEGSLFRVLPAQQPIDYVCELEIALQDLDWAWDVEARGMPSEPSSEGRLMILGPDHSFVLGSTNQMPFPQIARNIAACLSAETSDMVFYLPREPLDSLAFYGRPVAGAVAVDFRGPATGSTQSCGIFVDCRDLGAAIDFHIFATRVLSCADFVDTLGVDIPSGYFVRVEGYDCEAGQPDHFVFRHGAVATLWLELDVEVRSTSSHDPADQDADGLDEDDDGHDSRDPQDPPNVAEALEGSGGAVDPTAPPLRGSPGRSRSPRRHAATLLDVVHEKRFLCDSAFQSSSAEECNLRDLAQSPLITTLEAADQQGAAVLTARLCCKLQSWMNGGDATQAPDLVRPIASACRGISCLPPLGGFSQDADKSDLTATPVPISIDEHLGPQNYDIAKNCLQVIDDTDLHAIWRLCQPWESISLGTGPEWRCLHESTQAALALCADPDALPPPPVLEIYTDGSAKDDSAGYSVVCVGQWPDLGQTAFLGCFGGPVIVDRDQAHFVRAEQADAYHAEMSALVWAIFWCLAHWNRFGRPWLTIRFDAQVAGNFTSGLWEPSKGGIAEFAREASRFLEQCIGAYSIRWLHTKAHSGQPWNEMADKTAEACMQGHQFDIPLPRTGWGFLIGRINLTWALLVPMSCGSSAIPLNARGQLCWSEHESPPLPLCVSQVVPTGESFCGEQFNFCFKAVSANPQTCIGKYKYFEEQLCQDNVGLFFVQEARCHEGLVRSSNFFRFASEGQNHWGAEVWISRHASLASLDGQPIRIDESCVRVVSMGPRHLHLEIDLAGHKLHAASFHYPQRNRPDEDKTASLDILDGILMAADGCTCIIGMDANARVPLSFAEVTGDLYEDEEDNSGRQIVSVAARHNLWFPSTFDVCQSGPGKTWTQVTGSRSRIDYFLVSSDVPKRAVLTKVFSGFDLLTPNDDHEAILIDVNYSFVKWGSCASRLRRGQGFDVRRLRDPETLAAFDAYIDRCGLHYIPWDVDVNTHALWFQQAISGALSAVLPRKQDVPKSSYIPDEAWRLRQRKMELKKRTLQRKQGFRLKVQRAVFRIWNADDRQLYDHFLLGLRREVVIYELCAGAIQVATFRMKTMIKDKKNGMLSQLAQRFGHSRPDEIMGQLKAMHLGRKRQQPWKRNLPCIAGAAKAARTRDDLDQIWLAHFGKMEFGTVVDAASFFANPVVYPDADYDFLPDLGALPTAKEIEQAFRSTKSGKSPGLDLIPGEVLKRSPARLAAAVLPLFMKASMQRTQPVQWRGGILAECHKGKGPFSDPNSYRSLYVSSMVGKAYHKVIRQKALPDAERCFGASHFAAKKGSPVTMPSLMMILLERWQASRNWSSAMLFLDIQSAYYSIVRQLVYGDYEANCTDSQVCAVLKHFGLPKEAWMELVHAIQDGGIMRQAGTSGHLRALIKDSHDGSFFVTRYANGKQLCVTGAGSRPGESLADLVYAWIFHAVLQDIKQDLLKADVLLKIPFSGEKSPFQGEPTATIDFLGPTWADDATFACADRDPAVLVRKTQMLAAVVVDQCAKRGLVPNCKPGKTSIIMCLRGKGSRKEQQALFGDGSRHVEVLTTRFGQLHIPIVPAYVHLGCALEKGIPLCTEAHRRSAIASSAFAPLRGLVFQNSSIPMHIRGQLFTVFIDATYFNLEVWQGDADKGWHHLAQCHYRLNRRVLAKDFAPEVLQRMTGAEVVCLTEHPPLAILLRSRRLRFMVSLVTAAPDIIWALIQVECAWGQALLEDLAWFKRYAGDNWPTLDHASWPCWWHAIRKSPTAFRRAVGKAVRLAMIAFVSDGLRELLYDGMGRSLANAFPTALDRDVASCWFCPPCKMAFKTKANLACHFFKKHQRVAPQRLYKGDVICPCCLHDYVDQRRMQMHLKKNPKCLQYAVAHGFCGGEAGPGTGSKAWKELQAKNHIFCPPMPVDVIEATTGSHLGHSGSPVQNIIDGLAGRIGSFFDDAGECLDGDQTLRGLQSLFLDCPLLPSEMVLAIQQAIDDIQLCLRDGVLEWNTGFIAFTLEHLEKAKLLVSGNWLAAAVLDENKTPQNEKLLGVEHVPRIRLAVSSKFTTIRRIVVCSPGGKCFERTQISSLLRGLPWELHVMASSDYESELSDLVFHSCTCKGEAAAKGAGRPTCGREGRFDSAALEACLVDSLEQGRFLREVVHTWRRCWKALLQGQCAGIICNGPRCWLTFLQGFRLAGVCAWRPFVLPDVWALLMIPAAASDLFH